jgi:pyrroloquinoline quinone (PQQ) biosynthesis protein C
MTLFERLHTETQDAKSYLLSAPLIERCFAKQVSKEDYVGFLAQAFHHVKHTVPLLMAVGTKLSDEQEWLREAVAEYIEEEIGHQEWILNDIEACGYDKDAVRHSQPSFATELMVAYAYDSINRKNPLSFFGMVHVLEGTSIALADNAADAILEATGVPKNAFKYLRSHGAIDLEHVKFFEQIMNKITDPLQQQVIVDSANKFYRLYADIFRTIPNNPALAKAA